MSGTRDWLTTERLGLRRFGADDLDWLTRLHADAEVTRHLGGPKSPAEVDEMLRVRILGDYERHPGLGIWQTVERSTGQPVGCHLLNHVQGEAIVQVGFVLARPAWGRGYGTEMARAVLRYGFVTLGLPRINAIANLDNHASQRVLMKIGLRRNGERAFPHAAYAAAGPMAWFEREREDWLADGSPHPPER